MTSLSALLSRLKARQREIIMEAAKADMISPDGMLRQIAHLENAVAAVEAVAEEEVGRES